MITLCDCTASYLSSTVCLGILSPTDSTIALYLHLIQHTEVAAEVMRHLVGGVYLNGVESLHALVFRHQHTHSSRTHSHQVGQYAKVWARTGGSVHAVHKLVHHPTPIVLTVECLNVVLHEASHVRVLAEVLWGVGIVSLFIIRMLSMKEGARIS